MLRSVALLLLWACGYGSHAAEPLLLGVDQPFAHTAGMLAKQYQRQSGQPVELVVGTASTLGTHVVNAKPLDLLLISDSWRLQQLTENGHLLADAQLVIASDQLMLWSRNFPGLAVERLPELPLLVIASPRQTAYGVAAQQVLESYRLWGKLGSRLRITENASQAFEQVRLGSSPAGLVPRALLAQSGQLAQARPVPANRYSPIEYRAAIVTGSRAREQAGALQRYLRQNGRALIRQAGYAVP